MSDSIWEILNSTFQLSEYSYEYRGTNGTTRLLQVRLLKNTRLDAAIKNTYNICMHYVFHLTYSISRFLIIALDFLTEVREDQWKAYRKAGI